MNQDEPHVKRERNKNLSPGEKLWAHLEELPLDPGDTPELVILVVGSCLGCKSRFAAKLKKSGRGIDGVDDLLKKARRYWQTLTYTASRWNLLISEDSD